MEQIKAKWLEIRCTIKEIHCSRGKVPLFAKTTGFCIPTVDIVVHLTSLLACYLKVSFPGIVMTLSQGETVNIVHEAIGDS